jgi:hypothetical protein
MRPVTEAHRPSAEPVAAGSGPGTVVLDIGGDIGALILYTPEVLLGKEIEIRAAGGAWDGTHTGVRARQVPGGPVTAAVFGSLPAGGYELRLRGQADPAPSVAVTVRGGRVGEVDWPTGADHRAPRPFAGP